MLFFVFGALIVLLLIIVYEDCRDRAVSWPVFPLLAISGFFFSLMREGIPVKLVKNAFVNVCIVSVQVLLLYGYVRIRYQKGNWNLFEKIGWGDIFFLVAISFLFSPLNFFLFYIGSLIFSLIIYVILVLAKVWNANETTIPLAGLQASFLMIIIFCNLFFHVRFTSDDWILYKYVSASE